jgi:hypothetical protein
MQKEYLQQWRLTTDGDRAFSRQQSYEDNKT